MSRAAVPALDDTRAIGLLEAVVSELRGLRAALEARSGAAGSTGVPQALDPGDLLCQREVAALLGVDERTLRRWRRAGDAPKAITGGGRPRWKRSTVDAWLAGRAAE